MKLTRTQQDVLALLEKEPRMTSKTTHYGYVSGSAAKALIRLGLAKRARAYFYCFQVEITEAGRKALTGRGEQ